MILMKIFHYSSVTVCLLLTFENLDKLKVCGNGFYWQKEEQAEKPAEPVS